MRTSVFLFLIFCGATLRSVAQVTDVDIHGLFYCNENAEISRTWVFSENYSLHLRMKERFPWQIRDVILLNRENLLADSLSINDLFGVPPSKFIEVFDVLPENTNRYVIVHGNGATLITVEQNRISVVQKQIPGFGVQWKYGAVLALHGFTVGYERAGSTKQRIPDKRNFPFFWVIFPEQPTVRHWINRDMSDAIARTDFFPDKNLEFITDKTNYYRQYISIRDSVIIFNVPRSNKCFFLHLKTREVSYLQFPSVNKNECYFFFPDAQNHREYLVKRSEDSYLIYELRDRKQAYFRMEIDHVPIRFVNGRVYYLVETKMDGKKMTCHYLRSIDFDNDEKPILLEGIRIR